MIIKKEESANIRATAMITWVNSASNLAYKNTCWLTLSKACEYTSNVFKILIKVKSKSYRGIATIKTIYLEKCSLVRQIKYKEIFAANRILMINIMNWSKVKHSTQLINN